MTDTGTDARLVQLAQQGNRQAFAILSRRWGGRLHGFLRRVLGDDEQARDLCQDALFKAWLNITTLRKPDRFKTWLHTIALNLCRDHVRRHVNTVSLDDHDDDVAATEVSGPVWDFEQVDLGQALDRALAGITADQRTAILLHEVQGFTSVEIATITGVAAATVRSRIFYGLKALRGQLRAMGITRSHLEDQGGRTHD